jgi:hypothetical protein
MLNIGFREKLSYLKITNPGKNLIFLLKNAKIWFLIAFFPLSDEGSKNCSKS